MNLLLLNGIKLWSPFEEGLDNYFFDSKPSRLVKLCEWSYTKLALNVFNMNVRLSYEVLSVVVCRTVYFYFPFHMGKHIII